MKTDELLLSTDPVKLVAQIKKLVKTLGDLKARENVAHAQLYGAVYAWTETVMSRGKESQVFVLDTLASMVSKTAATVNRWYLCGSFMRSNKITPDIPNAKSINTLRKAEKTIERADFLKGMQMLKDGVVPGDISRHVHRAELKTGHAATKRLNQLKNAGGVTKLAVKMELQVAATMCTELFGEKVKVVVYGKDSGDRLIEVK